MEKIGEVKREEKDGGKKAEEKCDSKNGKGVRIGGRNEKRGAETVRGEGFGYSMHQIASQRSNTSCCTATHTATNTSTDCTHSNA